MKLIVEKTERISGECTVPSSKSHTIRGFTFASLAEGKSKLTNVLESEDTKATVDACSALGADMTKKAEGEFEISGFNGHPKVRETNIYTRNSGTTTNFTASVAALANEKIIIDGDDSIRRRPVQPLLLALRNLGAKAVSINNNGCPPVAIQGRMIGGKTTLECKSSQYLSSLLISCPLLEKDTEIEIYDLCELPYIEMTLKWLDDLFIKHYNKDFKKIMIFGGQRYSAFERRIPSDWSSGTFVLVAGAMLGDNVAIKGLDVNDTQADRYVLDHLHKIGSDIETNEREIVVSKSGLNGCELDLNGTPDALPAIAVLGCYAEGETVIRNVAHARIKETDRIRVMTEELSKMGAKIKETNDGMIIEHSRLKGAELNGHRDHRVVMALGLAGMIAEGRTVIDTAEAINVTFPDYVQSMVRLGSRMRLEA